MYVLRTILLLTFSLSSTSIEIKPSLQSNLEGNIPGDTQGKTDGGSEVHSTIEENNGLAFSEDAVIDALPPSTSSKMDGLEDMRPPDSQRPRVKRSATSCPPVIARNFILPTLEVFMTVNSISYFPLRAVITGEFYTRKLELNWILPSQSFAHSDDYIGLFRDNPLQGLSEPLVKVKPDSQGYHLTDVSFPHILPYFTQTELKSECLHNYWIAYLRGDRVMAVNCIKTHPRWMYEMREEIGSIPLHSLMIPGTHNSGAYKKIRSPVDDTFALRYSVNQEEDIWTQLLMGIRYLDLRVSYFDKDPKKFYLVHDVVRFSPLADAIRDVKRFLQTTKELVIMDFHRFPFGFDNDESGEGEARHRQLLDYLKQELGEWMAPDWLGRGVTINDLWHINRTLIVSSQSDSVESAEETIWPQVVHAWGDNRAAPALYSFLNMSMYQRSSATYLWSAMTHLTPSAFDAIFNYSGSLRTLNDKMVREINGWYRTKWWDKANIVATDFFLSNNIVDIALKANRKRKICRNIQLGA